MNSPFVLGSRLERVAWLFPLLLLTPKGEPSGMYPDKGDESIYLIDTPKLNGYDSNSVESKPHAEEAAMSFHSHIKDAQQFPDAQTAVPHAMELPEMRVKPTHRDSVFLGFRDYWTKVEERDEFDKLRKQIAAQDIDKSHIPRLYFFDSNLVILPGTLVIRSRKKEKLKAKLEKSRQERWSNQEKEAELRLTNPDD